MTARRVLLYSDAPTFSGGERYLLELIRGLPRERWVPELVTSEEGAVDGFVEKATALGVSVHRLPAIGTLSARGPLLKVTRFLATHRHDVTHFNLVDPRACNGAMVAARAALRRHLVVTEHLPSSPFDDGPLPFRHRIALRSTALTIVNSEELRRVVEGRRKNRSRIAVIPNGISDLGPPTPERRAAARAAMGLDDAGTVACGFLAWLTPRKDPDLLLEGARRVAPHHPAARFVVIGDGPELGRLQARVAELGLQDVVRFLGHREDARELLYGLDLLINTSRYEGQPFSLLEGMMAGVPALAPRIQGMAELVVEGISGRLFAPRDGDSLGTVLGELLSDREARGRMARVARERALTLHTSEAMGRLTADHYDAALSS